ncbi:MAG: SOS response-associated peptidase [Pseudomonadaceae bacterium]|nr:SOS response-associated peptidase [Pseudomonadaceae bacterium]
MCGRLNVTDDPLSALLMELVGMPHPGPFDQNIAPTATVTVLRLAADGSPELAPMRWWLTPHWAKEPTTRYSMFNAKSETLHKSPAFRSAFDKRRCVVPVSGFYEWARSGGGKLPYYIHPSEHAGLLLAGVWDRWHSKTDEQVIESFTIVTTAACEAMTLVHHRQPVMLSPGEAQLWLDTGAAKDELRALFEPHLPMALEALPVSSYVSNARNKGDRCIEPVAAPVALH